MIQTDSGRSVQAVGLLRPGAASLLIPPPSTRHVEYSASDLGPHARRYELSDAVASALGQNYLPDRWVQLQARLTRLDCELAPTADIRHTPTPRLSGARD